MEIEWSSTYVMPCRKLTTVNRCQIPINFSSSRRSIWCLAGNMFWRKKAGCRRTESILRPPWLNYVHAMVTGRLRIYVIPLASLHRAKTMVTGAYFCGFGDWPGASIRGNFGMNGLYSAVIQPSKALKYASIVFQLKWDVSAPIQCLVISATQ